jgi:hypothetical protein
MFDDNYIFYSLLLLVVLILGVWFFVLTRRRKANLQSVLAEFGTNILVKVGISSFDIQFERDGTAFVGSSVTTKFKTTFRLNFYLPQFNEKFLIRQNSSLAGFHAWMDEGQFSSTVSILGLPGNYLVLSPTPEFTKTFLSKKEVLAEIASLDAAFNYPRLWFEDGQFQMELFSDSGWNVVEKFSHTCHAAVVFHDNIKRLSFTKQ